MVKVHRTHKYIYKNICVTMIFKKGSIGDDVKKIQLALGVNADGIFGIKTENAVINFQKENGLVPDGIVGEKTLKALNVNLNIEPSIVQPVQLVIDEYHLPKGEYLEGDYKNDYIILHHTDGGANPRNVVDWWAKDDGKIGTEFVVGGQNCNTGNTKYDGKIVRAFPEGCQAYHIGASGSSYMNTHSVGIEMCNFGYIKNGKTYTGTNVKPEQIISLKEAFKDYKSWHRYSDTQICVVRELLLYIANRDNIDLHEGLYKWIKNEGAIKAFDFHLDAYKGNVKGLLTHTNIRRDKFDCSPQPNLVDMIMSL
jgi:peptidoglycan hydrolase-like protein with peptidoglycan-binding domain